MKIYRTFWSGASRDRTGDLLLAKQALSQLSYGPAGLEFTAPRLGVAGLAPPWSSAAPRRKFLRV
jgi:hypothetical protein